jgi:hypothetical protein
VDQNCPSKNQKNYVPGFSAKYSTIWGRNMNTKHTTGEHNYWQLTWIFGEDLLENKGQKISVME